MPRKPKDTGPVRMDVNEVPEWATKAWEAHGSVYWQDAKGKLYINVFPSADLLAALREPKAPVRPKPVPVAVVLPVPPPEPTPAPQPERVPTPQMEPAPAVVAPAESAQPVPELMPAPTLPPKPKRQRKPRVVAPITSEPQPTPAADATSTLSVESACAPMPEAREPEPKRVPKPPRKPRQKSDDRADAPVKWESPGYKVTLPTPKAPIVYKYEWLPLPAVKAVVQEPWGRGGTPLEPLPKPEMTAKQRKALRADDDE